MRKEITVMRNKTLTFMNRVQSKTTEVATNNVTKAIVPQLPMTNEFFMDYLAQIHAQFLFENRNMNVGMATVIIDTASTIYLIQDDEKFKVAAINFLSLTRFAKKEKIGDIRNFGGTKQYVPVNEYKSTLHGKEFTMVVVSNDTEALICEQLKVVDLNDVKNLRLIFRDLNDLGRKAQELTVDAEKKLYKVDPEFFVEGMRSESTIHLAHGFKGFTVEGSSREYIPLSIARKNCDFIVRNVEVGDIQVKRNFKGEITNRVVHDDLAEIQNICMEYAEDIVNNTGLKAYRDTDLSEETKADFDLTGTTGKLVMDYITYIVKAYNLANTERQETCDAINKDNTLSHYNKAELLGKARRKYEERIKVIDNKARFFSKDLSMVDAGRVMMAASYARCNGTTSMPEFKDSDAHSFYSQVAAELGLAYVTDRFADVKDSGYRLRGKTKNFTEDMEGTVMHFVDGIGEDGVYVDDVYTGDLTLKLIDGNWFATVNINDLLEANRIAAEDVNEVELSLFDGSVVNVDHFKATGELKYGMSFYDLFTSEVYTSADHFVLYPRFEVALPNGKTRVIKNAIVAVVPSDFDPSEMVEIPVARYLCYSNTFAKHFAGAVVTSFEADERVTGRNALLVGEIVDRVDVELGSDELDYSDFYADREATVPTKQADVDFGNAFGDVPTTSGAGNSTGSAYPDIDVSFNYVETAPTKEADVDFEVDTNNVSDQASQFGFNFNDLYTMEEEEFDAGNVNDAAFSSDMFDIFK